MSLNVATFPRLAFLSLAVVMQAGSAVHAADEKKSPGGPAVPKLECRLVIEPNSDADVYAFDGDFALKNTSASPIKIEGSSHPILLHVDVDVRDDKGKLLSKNRDRYGTIFSPNWSVPDFRVIEPGDTATVPLWPLGLVDQVRSPITPGTYTIEAVFRWKGQEVRSNTVKIVIEENNADAKARRSLQAARIKAALSKLEPRLVIKRKPGLAPLGCDVDFELKNTTGKPIELETSRDTSISPFELDVWNEKGVRMPDGSGGYVWPPFLSERKPTVIKSGEVVSRRLPSFAEFGGSRVPLATGTYTVEATLDWNGQTIRSNKVKIEIVRGR